MFKGITPIPKSRDKTRDEKAQHLGLSKNRMRMGKVWLLSFTLAFASRSGPGQTDNAISRDSACDA